MGSHYFLEINENGCVKPPHTFPQELPSIVKGIRIIYEKEKDFYK
jgi:hypothetical protein